MRFFAVAAALAATASAATITVTVGENNGLTYNPTSVTAAAGDVVAFQFLSKSHTVTQSTFAAPCENMTTPTEGIDSGFQTVDANATQVPSWSFTVMDASTPLWFYCRQVGHCQKGMVFAVNPTAAKTFDAFQATAMGTNGTASGSSASGSSATGTASSSAASGTGTSTAANNGASSIGFNSAALLAFAGVLAGMFL